MIGHLSYVICDCCGDPAQPEDDARDARKRARKEGYGRRGTEDLCSFCIVPEHRPCSYKQWRTGALPDPSQGEVER